MTDNVATTQIIVGGIPATPSSMKVLIGGVQYPVDHVAVTGSTKASTIFGIDPYVSDGSYGLIQPEFGCPLYFARCFDGGTGILTAWNTAKAQIPKTSLPAISFKVWSPADFQTFLGGLDRTTWVCFFHEPEGDFNKGNTTASPANLISVYAAMDAARKAHANGHYVKLFKALTSYRQPGQYPFGPATAWQAYHGWSYNSTTRTWEGTGQTFIDAFGWDTYIDPLNATKGIVPTGAQLIGPLKTMHDTILYQDGVDVPWCAPELGIFVPSSGVISESALSTAVADYVQFCQNNGALWVNWWWSPQAGTEVGSCPLEPHPAAFNIYKNAVVTSTTG